MNTYRIEYLTEHGFASQELRATSGGDAIKIILRHGQVEVTGLYEGFGNMGWKKLAVPPKSAQVIGYEPRAPKPPKPDNKDGVMPFYDDVISHRR